MNGVEEQLICAASAHGDEQRTSIILRLFAVITICALCHGAGSSVLREWRWRRRWGWGGREVRATYDAQLDTRVDKQRETDGVLSAAQEPLRPVDQIECPHARNYMNARTLRKKIFERKRVIRTYVLYARWRGCLYRRPSKVLLCPTASQAPTSPSALPLHRCQS